MGKKFVGLDGLKHFWTKAKTWITGQITAEVTAKIAEIVANAPEDLDTLKEIADWIKTHANDASAMNKQINTNKSDISALKTSVAGKANSSHTHTKSQITDFPTSLKNPNALTVNGKTYDGSSAVNAGVQTVANGGTGQTTANAAANSFINSLTPGGAIPVDNDYYISQYVNGGTNTTTYHRRPVSKLWEYIKGKISSVLGLTATAYSGKASTAGTAVFAKNMYSKTLDLSSLDKTKFYPVFCLSANNFAEVAIRSPQRFDIEEYNQNIIHFDISTYGWSDMPYTLNIREYGCYQNNEITIGCIGRGIRHGGWAIWLRGGLRYDCWTRDCELSLETSDYTYNDEKYTVGTNYYGGANANVTVIFTPQSTITNGAYSNRPVSAPNITSLEQRATSLETELGELDGKISSISGSSLPWHYNFLDKGYSSSLQYRKICEGYFNYLTGYENRWDFHSEIEIIYRLPRTLSTERGTLYIDIYGDGSTVDNAYVRYHSENGVVIYGSNTAKISYKVDTTNKRVYLEVLARCTGNWNTILYRSPITRGGDMLVDDFSNFWTFVPDGSYTQSSTTMQSGVTEGYTEIPLKVVSTDSKGRDIVTIYATKDELTKAVPTYSADDAGKSLAVNSDGTGTEWVKPKTIKFADYRTESLTFSSLTDQKGIALANFGPDVTENNVLSFMVIYWTGVHIIAQADWARSQGTNSSGLRCALHALNNGTGWCVIRCVYLA